MKLFIHDFEIQQSQLNQLLASDNNEDLQKWTSSLQPADLALLIEETQSPDDQFRIFDNLEDRKDQLEVLSFLGGDAAQHIASNIKTKELVEIVDEMASDEAVDFLDELPNDVSQKILSTLPDESASELRELGRYEEGTAGALITTDFLYCNDQTTVGELLEDLKETASEIETLDTGFVLSENEKILGIFSLKELFSLPSKDLVKHHMDDDFVFGNVNNSEEEILQLFNYHILSILPIVDHSGVMKGIITADDMLDVAKGQSDEDFYHMVGTTGNPTERSILSRVRHRLPWLASTLLGGALAGLILKLFTQELSQFPILMSGIPFVIAMAGNVGVQSATIIVREFVNQDTTASHMRKNIISEVNTAMANALVFSSFTFIVMTILAYSQDWPLFVASSSIALGLFLAMCFAGLIGATAPLVFNRLNIDPAISSGPIITVTVDVIGLSIYLGITTSILKAFNIVSLSF